MAGVEMCHSLPPLSCKHPGRDDTSETVPGSGPGCPPTSFSLFFARTPPDWPSEFLKAPGSSLHGAASWEDQGRMFSHVLGRREEAKRQVL